MCKVCEKDGEILAHLLKECMKLREYNDSGINVLREHERKLKRVKTVKGEDQLFE